MMNLAPKHGAAKEEERLPPGAIAAWREISSPHSSAAFAPSAVQVFQGLDLSGTRGGAGGVGGLLMAQVSGEHLFYGYDANGNVTDLVDPADGDWLGGYDYDAFGRTCTSAAATLPAGATPSVSPPNT